MLHMLRALKTLDFYYQSFFFILYCILCMNVNAQSHLFHWKPFTLIPHARNNRLTERIPESHDKRCNFWVNREIKLLPFFQQCNTQYTLKEAQMQLEKWQNNERNVGHTHSSDFVLLSSFHSQPFAGFFACIWNAYQCKIQWTKKNQKHVHIIFITVYEQS